MIKCLLFLVVSFIVATPVHQASAEVIDRIAAVVGSDIITEHQISRAVSARERAAGTLKPDANIRQETLEKMIDNAVLTQLLSKSKIEVSEDDLTRAIANILQKNRMSIDELKSEVSAKGMSYDEYKKQVETEIKRIKFVNQVIGPQVSITDQDLRDYYQRNQDRFRASAEAHIAEIILPTAGVTTQEEMDHIGEIAVSITSRARRGANFAELARQYSKGPNSESGGDIGMVNLKDIQPEVAGAVQNMKIGEVSPPIITENAVVIVKLISLPEISAGDFEKLRDDIYASLYDQKIDETLKNYLAKERQKAFIEVR